MFPQKFRYFTDQNGPKRGSHDNEFWHFSNTNISRTVKAQNVYEKNGVICLVSFFLSWVMVLKLPKIVHFLQICPDLSKKSWSIKAIYISIWKASSCSFKKFWFIGVWETVQQILRNKISKNCWNSRNLTKFTIFKH